MQILENLHEEFEICMGPKWPSGPAVPDFLQACSCHESLMGPPRNVEFSTHGNQYSQVPLNV